MEYVVNIDVFFDAKDNDAAEVVATTLTDTLLSDDAVTQVVDQEVEAI